MSVIIHKEYAFLMFVIVQLVTEVQIAQQLIIALKIHNVAMEPVLMVLATVSMVTMVISVKTVIKMI